LGSTSEPIAGPGAGIAGPGAVTAAAGKPVDTSSVGVLGGVGVAGGAADQGEADSSAGTSP
jgi:hypothetical protein